MTNHSPEQSRLDRAKQLSAILIGTLWLSSIDLHSQERPRIIISEFLASNQQGLSDGDGDRSDWIELWNPTSEPLSTEGLYLTDDRAQPSKWPLPKFTIDSDGYALIFASGKNRIQPEAELHTSFRLNRRTGGFLALTQQTTTSLTVLSEYPSYPEQYADRSYGWSTREGRFTYFQTPTPGRVNHSSAFTGRVADTQFSLDRGFYHEPINVVISTETPGSTLIYTTDGSQPTSRHGHRVEPQGPNAPSTHELTLSETTSLRVMAIKPGFESTNIDTQTYIFPDRVLQQDEQFHAIGNTTRWGHAGPDWEMDPEIINHSDPEVRPQPSDLLEIASVSLSLDFADLFGRQGIYIAGQSVEKDSSIEYLEPAFDEQSEQIGLRSFQVDGTVQIVGGSSPNRWKSDKLSLRLKFPEDLEFNVFDQTAVNRFDTLVLDARLNNVWHYGGGVEPVGQRNRAQYVRDQYAANLHNQLDGHSPHGRHVHLYINGIYWGIHTLHERPDDNFAASYLGGDNSDYDSIKHRPNDVLQGSSANYQRLHSTADQLATSPDRYGTIEQQLHIPDFINYMLVNYYVGNTDWAHHNWYASYNHVDSNGRWRFHSWDAEKGLHGVNDDRTGRNDSGGPTNLHHDLMRHPEYRLQFADQAIAALEEGPLTPAAAAQSYLEISEPISKAIRIESARWGDNQRARPFTRLDWLETRNQLFGQSSDIRSPLSRYFERRSRIVLDQFDRRGWLPSISPPELSEPEGFVQQGFMVGLRSLDANSQIYFTTNGEDPRIPGIAGQSDTTELVIEGAWKRARIPENDQNRDTWFLPDFDDSDWPRGRRGAGYENNSGYQDLIDPALDFRTAVNGQDFESIQLRVEFELTSNNDFDHLTLLLRYDDGYVAYLNGTEVSRANASGRAGQTLAWNAQATNTHSDAEAETFLPIDLTPHLDLLRPGRNVLAVLGLNRGPSSSDFLIWPRLEAGRVEGGNASGISEDAKRYTTPLVIDHPTVIKARAKQGETWSAIRVAAFLPTTDLPSPENLIVSRVHYHPSAPTADEQQAGFTSRSHFEFLELTNLSERHILLSGSSFADGLRYQFTGRLPQMAPSESVVLVADPAAYRSRYGDETRIVGTFALNSQLSNDGERITFVDATGSLVFSFRYNDAAPWPQQADGLGFALVRRTMNALVNPSDATAWAAEPVDRVRVESPQSLIASWIQEHFTPAERANLEVSDLRADPDADGLSNIQELFHGTDPRQVTDHRMALEIQTDPLNEPQSIRISFRQRTDFPTDWWTIESSSNLITWEPFSGEFQTTSEGNDSQVNRLTAILDNTDAQRFIRISIAIPNG